MFTCVSTSRVCCMTLSKLFNISHSVPYARRCSKKLTVLPSILPSSRLFSPRATKSCLCFLKTIIVVVIVTTAAVVHRRHPSDIIRYPSSLSLSLKQVICIEEHVTKCSGWSREQSGNGTDILVSPCIYCNVVCHTYTKQMDRQSVGLLQYKPVHGLQFRQKLGTTILDRLEQSPLEILHCCHDKFP